MTNEESKQEIEKKPNIPKENKKKNNPILIILVILISIALLVGAFILGTKFANHESPQNKEKQQTLEVYAYEYGEICKEKEESCQLIASIPVNSKDARILDGDEGREGHFGGDLTHILYQDETLKIYNLETKSITETNLTTEHDKYGIQVSYDEKEVLGIVLHNSDEEGNTTYSAYYDIKTKKILLENKYDNIYAFYGKYLRVESYDEYYNGNVVSIENYESYMLNIETQEEVLETHADIDRSIEIKNNNVYIYEMTPGIGRASVAVYNENMKELVPFLTINYWGFTKDNNIYKVDGNKIVTINYEGEIISTSKEYGNIIHHIDFMEPFDFILYDDGKNVYITDEKNYTVKLFELKQEMYYDFEWYYKTTPEEANESSYDTKPGLYFTFLYIEDTDESPGKDVYFNPETKEVTIKEFRNLHGPDER